ncbi:hypothetical protein ACEWY4_006967 [Coilia grayii]|uniref:UBC core domain-containing protein n=1 Tax=Coilia grayii TaxID=363190 RepID=A0ABD1KF81_9TELE
MWEGTVTDVYLLNCLGLLSLYFYERHSQLPPYVVFTTVPFHPNVDRDTGKVWVSFPNAGNEWDPNTSIFSILQYIQYVLSHPILDNPVNVEAAEMLMNTPHIYRKVVEQCVKTSRALEQEDLATEADPNQPLGRDRIVKRISFEEYLQAWTKLATSKAGSLMTNESLSPAQVLFHHCGSLPHKLIPFTEACLETVKDLMYGPPPKYQRTRVKQTQYKLLRIQQMRKLYQHYSTPEPLKECPAVPPVTAQSSVRHKDLEAEVDVLVAWTHTLSLEQLEHDY